MAFTEVNLNLLFDGNGLIFENNIKKLKFKTKLIAYLVIYVYLKNPKSSENKTLIILKNFN